VVQRDGVVPTGPRGVPTPARDVSLLPTTYSDLNYFWRCNFEYQLRALMGFGPGVKESYGYGQQIHHILAEIHQRAEKGEELTVDEVMNLVEKRFHLRYTRDGDRFKPLTKLREAAQLSLKRYLEKFPDTSKYVLASEKPFEFVDPESQALISGTIDLLQRVDETSAGKTLTPVAVVDFKTHRFRDKESFERSRTEVEAQLTMYAVAARRALGFDAKAARAHFLTPKDVPDYLKKQGVKESFTVDISESKQDEIRDRIGKTVAGIRTSLARGEFKLTGPSTDHCKTCDYHDICPGFANWKSQNPAIPRPLRPEEARQQEIQRVAEDIDARD
jgi:DNA helicase-2/ATP-dependent DNA helicase PcrA